MFAGLLVDLDPKMIIDRMKPCLPRKEDKVFLAVIEDSAGVLVSFDPMRLCKFLRVVDDRSLRGNSCAASKKVCEQHCASNQPSCAPRMVALHLLNLSFNVCGASRPTSLGPERGQS